MHNRNQELESILLQNQTIKDILQKAPLLGLPDWYLGAGCISQTVWNHKHGFDLNYGIKDYDLVYFDANNTSYEAEDVFIQKGKEIFGDHSVEIINEARVHLWFKEHFGYDIEPYQSTELAIDTWPTTATCVGIRNGEDGKLIIYAPYGLEDLFNLTVRANKGSITEKVFQKKVDKWTKLWPNLKVIPW